MDGSGEPPAAGRNGERDFHGEKRSNQTHTSTTDPDARLYKKSPGSAAKLCHMGHAVMENRNGLVVATEMTPATGFAEREAAVAMVEALAGGQHMTLGADKAYDTADFVAEMRRLGVTPHVSQNTNGRRSAIDCRTTRHPGYAISVRVRKRIEEVFGWMKTRGRVAQDASPWHGTGRMDVHVGGSGLQRGTDPQAVGCCAVIMPRVCRPA
jgi:hypothetical protein